MRSGWVLGVVVGAVLALATGCKKEASDAPGPVDDRPPAIPMTEVKRGQDACNAYVAQICACTAPAAAKACELAKAMPEALKVGLEVSVSPDSDRRSVLHANDSVRKTIKRCIEHTAQLPSLGC